MQARPELVWGILQMAEEIRNAPTQNNNIIGRHLRQSQYSVKDICRWAVIRVELCKTP